MKLSFSTVGCPDWMLNEVIAAAKDFAYDGIEIRGIGDDLFLPGADVFGPKRIKKSLEELENSGLEIPCIATDASCQISSQNPDVVSNLKEYIDLANLVGAKSLRILGDEWEEAGVDVDIELAYDNLSPVVPYAEEKNIKLLIETNGVFAQTALTREFVQRFSSPVVGVLWDLHHPYTYFNESPEQTAANIGEYVGHVHVKDSQLSNGKTVYKMLGHGELPIKDLLACLGNLNYQGFLSLEWVKRWNSELEDPGIVFPHYIKKMRKFLNNK